MSIPIRPKLYKNGIHVKIPYINERLGINRFDDWLPMTVSYGSTAERALNQAIEYANMMKLDFDEIHISFGNKLYIKNMITGLVESIDLD